MSVEALELVLTGITTLTVGGVISAIIALRYAKRNALANTQKTEAEAAQEQHKVDQEKYNTDSIAIENAAKLIQLYQEGLNKLTELHESQSKELEDRCARIEEQWRLDKKEMQDQIDQLRDYTAKLETKLAVYEANSDKQELVEENAKLKLENKSLKKQLAKKTDELEEYKRSRLTPDIK